MQIYKADFALNFIAIFIWIGAGIFNIAIFFVTQNLLVIRIC